MILRNCKNKIQENKYDGLKIYMLKFIWKRKKDQSADSLSLPLLSFFSMWGQKKAAIFKSERGPSPEVDHADTLIPKL